MQYAGQPSWRIELDEPVVLVIGLFLRDLVGLRPDTQPALPRLDPAVEPVRQVEGDLCSQQWALWWRGLLEQGAGALAGNAPPDFTDLAHSPELRELLRSEFRTANDWASQRHREHAQLVLHGPRPGVEGEVVREAERNLGRQAQPFRLRITELPVQGQHGWRLGADDVLVSRSLLTDRDAYRNWLAPVVADLV